MHDYDIPISDKVKTETPNVLLYCDDHDQYLYSKGASDILFTSAAVKLMVGAVALELYADRLDEVITVTDDLLEGSQGLVMYLDKGDTVTVNYLIHAVLMYGANDASTILARLHTGNINDFIQVMNEKAKSCGAKNTVYKNVTGLYADGMTTTLYDQIKIAEYAAGVKGLTDITVKEKYVPDKGECSIAKTVNSRNLLITKYQTAGVNGMCYGSTDESGDVLIVSAVIGGMTYYMALYGGTTEEGQTEKSVFADAISLLEYAQEGFGFVTVLSSGKLMCETKVKYNTTVDTVALVPESDVMLYLPLNIDTEKDLQYRIVVYKEALDAPVQEGQEEGKVIVSYNGKEICSAALVTKNPVSRNKILYVIDCIEEFTSDRRFLITVGVFAVLVIVYILISSIIRQRLKKRRRRLR